MNSDPGTPSHKKAHTYRKFEKHIYQRVDRDGNVVPDTWALKVDIGRDLNSGKRRTRWYTVKGGIREARRELAKVLHQVNEGLRAEPEKKTVAEFLEQWLEQFAKPGVARRTYDDYSAQVRRRLIPGLGHIRLSKLQQHPTIIQQFYSQLQADGCSPEAIKRVHKVLSQACNRAVKWRMLSLNPCHAVDAPRVPRRAMNILTPQEAAHVLEQVEGTRLYIPVLLGVMTGMRIGEICALHWREVDLDKKFLQVRFAIERTYDGLRLKEPKTVKSRRKIDLDDTVVEALRRWKLKQAEERLRLGPCYSDNDLVVCKVDGNIIHPTTVSVDFHEVVKRLGYKVRFHDLRHTHLSWLLMNNTHPKIASERAGHSSIAITLDLYSHVIPGLQSDAVDKVGEALRNAMATHAAKKTGG